MGDVGCIFACFAVFGLWRQSTRDPAWTLQRVVRRRQGSCSSSIETSRAFELPGGGRESRFGSGDSETDRNGARTEERSVMSDTLQFVVKVRRGQHEGNKFY